MKVVGLRLVFIYMLVVQNVSIAKIIEIATNPRTPISSSVFTMDIVAETTRNSSFNIRFDKGDLEVISRKRILKRSFAKMVNGKIETVQIQGYRYQVIADKRGSYWIKNISFTTGKNVYTKKVFNIEVKKVLKNKPPMYVEIETSSDEVFYGEGVDLKYYVYSVILAKAEVRTYPKLTGVIKRFYTPSFVPQKTVVDGKIYHKYLVYHARLFPEKTGMITVGALKVRIDYKSSFGTQTHKILTSNKKKFNVLKLPKIKKNIDYSGLVGPHKINIKVSNKVYPLNSPIAVKVDIVGTGKVENFDFKSPYIHQMLESFDVKSEIVEIDRQVARKTFEFTYLGRSELDIKKREIDIYYFDKEKMNYVPLKVIVPSLKIGKVALVKDDAIFNKRSAEEATRLLPSTNIIAPSFTSTRKSINWINVFNLIVFCLIILVASTFLISFRKEREEIISLKIKTEEIRKEGIIYSRLYGFLSEISESCNIYNIQDSNVLIKDLITGSSISEKGKKYFTTLIDRCEKQDFNNKSEKLKFRKKYFQELIVMTDKRLRNYEKNKIYRRN